MNKRILIAIGVASFLFAACVFIPATFIEAPVNARLGDQASFRVTGGTIWSGTGIFSLGNIRTRQASQEIPFSWSFAPSGLFGLRLSADVVANGALVRGSARVGAGVSNLKISRADLVTSLEIATRMNANLALLRPSGEIRTITQDDSVTISYSNTPSINGRLFINANDVRLRTVTPQIFGSYEAQLTFDDQRINYNINKSSGMLNIFGSGTVAWVSVREFRYQGFASTTRAAPNWLPATLLTVGRLTPDGRINIDYKTSW